MTDDQKRRIKQMRGRGMDYAKIADTLGISQNAIRVHCQRNGLTIKKPEPPSPPIDEKGICVQCGKTLVSEHQTHFCSSICRSNWWTNHPEHIKRTCGAFYTCRHCDKRFFSYAKRKYCSHSCYIRDRFKSAEDVV